MNPVFEQWRPVWGLAWWFVCPVQAIGIGPFSTENAAYEARSAQYSYDAIKSKLNNPVALDLPIEEVL